MNKERMAYIAPTSELLVVRFEQNLMTSTLGTSGFGEQGNVQDLSEEDWW